MFNDRRSKRVLFLAHCVLNQNAISDGTASFSGVNETILRLLLDANVGIVQMPCPEMNCLGLDRGDREGANRPLLEENSRIRREMNRTGARRMLDELVRQVLFQIEEYERFGFEVVGIVGINRSPSCGIDTTSKDNVETEGKGVFLELISEELKRRDLKIPLVGIKDSEPEKTEKAIRSLLQTK